MGRPYVFITRKLPDDIVAPLYDKYDVNMWPHEHLVVPRDVLLQEASRAEALITMLSDRIDEELLKKVRSFASLRMWPSVTTILT